MRERIDWNFLFLKQVRQAIAKSSDLALGREELGPRARHVRQLHGVDLAGSNG